MKKTAWSIGIIAAIVLIWFFAGSSASNVILEGEGVVYKSSSCGCCSVWSDYMGKTGIDLTVMNREDLDTVKDDFGIPHALRSCHTMQIGRYFIEGHIPAEAIERLLTEQPDIAGIAMPGMPSGSPGMPGAKIGQFVIYAVNHDGTYEEYMRI